MRIGLQTWGSEGDVRPFLALGHALAKRGHQVELVYTEIAERNYEAVAATLGFTARPLATPVIADPTARFELGSKILHTRDQVRQGLLIYRHLLAPVVEPMFQAAIELCDRSDLLIHHFMLHGSRAAAELKAVPAISVGFVPMMVPSRFICPQIAPRLGEWGNLLEWQLVRFICNRTFLRDVNRLRTRAGLPRFSDLLEEAWPSPVLNLLAASPALLTRPPDWDARHQLCGFLELPSHEHEPLSAEVETFLANGSPPVFMGFGSLMPNSGGRHLDESVAILEDAARRSGHRAIIQAEVEPSTTPGASRQPTDRVLCVKRAPHKLIFPRCAAVVHHAGAGTTHTTLRAGVPSVPVPHLSDQFIWADELRRLGVAPKAIRRSALTGAKLAERIREVMDNPRMKQAAMALSVRMQSDNGPETAADMIERSMGWNGN